MQHVATQVKSQIEDFKPYIPLIQGLRNPGMRSRHWELLSDELGFPIKPKQTLTFEKCLELGLQNHIDKIAKVAEVAGKEYSIEQVRPLTIVTCKYLMQKRCINLWVMNFCRLWTRWRVSGAR